MKEVKHFSDHFKRRVVHEILERDQSLEYYPPNKKTGGVPYGQPPCEKLSCYVQIILTSCQMLQRNAEHRNGRVVHRIFGKATEKQVRQAAALVGSHHNEVGFFFTSELNDGRFFIEGIGAGKEIVVFEAAVLGKLVGVLPDFLIVIQACRIIQVQNFHFKGKKLLPCCKHFKCFELVGFEGAGQYH